MADTKTKAATRQKATAIAKTAAPRKTSTKKHGSNGYASEERHKMIQDAAYFIAERNNFAGDPHSFWLEAEAQLGAL